MARPLRIALLGPGTVGSNVPKILAGKPELIHQLILTVIFGRNLAEKRQKPVFDCVDPNVVWTEDIDHVFATKPDIVVETMGGIEPARGIISRALESDIHVVTANKKLLAQHGQELFALAAKHNRQLRFEASVCGGVPVIQGIREGLSGDVFTGVGGILNGTCNYILSRMAETGLPQDVILKQAQKDGLAEREPSSDLNGNDAAYKLKILAGVALGKHLDFGQIRTKSIARVSDADFRYAKRMGCTIRQISQVRQQPDGYSARVSPTLVPCDSRFGRTTGAGNVVSTYGKYGGENHFGGLGAGGSPTAVAVVSDLRAIASFERLEHPEAWTDAPVVSSTEQPWYLRFVVRDQLGILADISSVLRDQGINIHTVDQMDGFPTNALCFAITTNACKGLQVKDAMLKIRAYPWNADQPLIMPILKDEK